MFGYFWSSMVSFFSNFIIKFLQWLILRLKLCKSVVAVPGLRYKLFLVFCF